MWGGLLGVFFIVFVLFVSKYTIMAETIPYWERSFLQEDNLSSFLTTKPLPVSKESNFENRCHQANDSNLVKD